MQGAETLSLDPVLVWAGAIALLLSVGTSLWSLLSSPARKNGQAIAELRGKQEGHELRMQRIEDKLAQAPDREMLHRVELSMARMEGHIDRIDERLRPVAAIAERMQELMLEQAKGK